MKSEELVKLIQSRNELLPSVDEELESEIRKGLSLFGFKTEEGFLFGCEEEGYTKPRREKK